MKVIEFNIEKSLQNEQCLILVATDENGQKYVCSGDSYSPTYLVKYENAFDNRPRYPKKED